jgi:hypothetical protein
VKKASIRICGDLKSHLDNNEVQFEDTATKLEEDRFELEKMLDLSNEQELDAVA